MTTLIHAEALNKYYGKKHALKDVSFTLESGEPVALVGPNGAGKTTLFSILCGYLQADSGKLELFGRPGFGSHCFGQLAALPQDAQLDPRFSISKQLGFFAKLQGMSGKQASIETERVLDLVALTDAKNERPQALSHGMRKRACIAQALIGAPSIVMLDEATAGLDPKHAKEVREVVAQLSGDITFVLSSHDLAELERLCSRVYYLEMGQLSQYFADQSESNANYFTVRLRQQHEGFVELITGMQGVLNVTETQDREFTIKVAQSEQPFDIGLLSTLHQNNIEYRQINNGKTLENQLFSE